MINLNIPTMLIHLVFFLIMMAVLNELLLKPLLKVMDEREKRVEGNQAAAEEAESKGREMKKNYQERIELARKESVSERDRIRKAADEEENKIIVAARGKAGDLIAEIREKISGEYQQASAVLESEAEAMGREIAARILGRQV